MKRLIMLIMVMASCMLSAVSIQSIRAEDYSGAACRLVITMDQDVGFTVKKQGNDFYLTINNFDGQIPSHNLNGTFLDRLEPTAAGVKVSSRIQLRYLTMRLSDTRALVIDFLRYPRTKKEGLAIASFLSDMGRLSSADKEYQKLLKDYPDHYDILYAWGELLVRRGSARAAEKLAQIPKFSSYYPAAQDLLHSRESGSKPGGRSEEIQEEWEQETALMQEDADQEFIETPLQDSIIFIIPPEAIHVEKLNLLGFLAKLANRYILLTIVVFVVLLVIVACLIFGRRKKSPKRPKPDIEENSQGLDTDTLCKIVNRLLADGWTNKEISRELKISQHEVELIVRRLHYMEMHEDDVEK